jgi:hypothetical protein
MPNLDPALSEQLANAQSRALTAKKNYDVQLAKYGEYIADRDDWTGQVALLESSGEPEDATARAEQLEQAKRKLQTATIRCTEKAESLFTYYLQVASWESQAAHLAKKNSSKIDEVAAEQVAKDTAAFNKAAAPAAAPTPSKDKDKG